MMYSKSNNLIFTSEIIGINPATSTMADGIENQTHQLLKNLTQLLESAGTSINNTIKVSIFLARVDDYEIVESIYKTYFKNYYPALSVAEVDNLPINTLIKAEAIVSIG